MSSYIPKQGSKIALAFARLPTLGRSKFFRNFFVVLSGTALAQLLAFAFAPVLSRLYGPVDFAAFGSFLSMVGILSAGVTLQYPEAMMLPEREETAAALLIVACSIALILSGMVAVLCLCIAPAWLEFVHLSDLGGWVWLIPFAALVAGFNQTLMAWCARRKAFKRTAVAQVVRSLTGSAAQLGGGALALGGGGLISGGVIGELLANVALWRWVVRQDRAILAGALKWRPVLSAARAYQDFPCFSAPQNLMNAISQGAPVILLIFYYGPVVGGLYAFSVRVLQVPMNFILTSLRQVLFQKLSEEHNRGGDLAQLFTRCTLTLASLGLIPAVIGFVFAPRVFAWVFGHEWGAAGEYARWLIVWFLPGFCNLPAALSGRILRRQKLLLWFDIVLLVVRMAVLLLGGTYLAPIATVALFSVVGAGFNVWLIFYVWRLLAIRSSPGRLGATAVNEVVPSCI